MKLSSHLGKITWSLADKGLYMLYGFVQIWQVQALEPSIYGVFALLVALNTWIMIVSDGSALNGLIQFGTDPADRKRVNAIGLVIHVGVLAVSSLIIFALQKPLSQLFNEKQFVTVAIMLPAYCMLTLPRMFCLKLVYREMRMRDLFFIDFIWFGVRTIMTAWAISTDSLHSLEDIIRIDFVGMGASSVAALFFTRRELRFSWKGDITFREYLRYGIPLAIAGALNSTPSQLDVLVIAAFFGVSVVGVYNIAKNLYRFFEQAFDAATTLIYPAAVRMIVQQRTEDLQVLITKAISVTLLPSIVALLILELGGSSIIVPILGERYAASVDHFNVLIIAALGMPFVLMSSVIAAMGHSTSIVKFSAIGLVVGLVTLITISYLGYKEFIGLGLVTNTITVGLLCTIYVRQSVHFPLSALMRAVQDVRLAISKRFQAS